MLGAENKIRQQPKGSNKKKEEKVGLCPTFGDPPAPPQYGTPLTNFTKKVCTLGIIH